MPDSNARAHQQMDAAAPAQHYTSQNKCALEIRSSAGESIIRILYTGQVELSPHCNVDEAASIFWENVQKIGVKLAAAQPDTHMRELAAYRLTVENLEREIKPLRLYENLAKEFGLEVFESLAELQKDNVVLRMRLQSAMEVIATPARPDGTWNRDRQACCKLAQAALSGIGPSSDMPDLTQLTQRGSKAWAGVNAQDLREGKP